MSTKRVIIIVGSVVSALLVAVVVTLVIMLNTMNAQAENDRYQQCMARHGFPADKPVGAVSDEDAYLHAIAAAAEACSSD